MKDDLRQTVSEDKRPRGLREMRGEINVAIRISSALAVSALLMLLFAVMSFDLSAATWRGLGTDAQGRRYFLDVDSITKLPGECCRYGYRTLEQVPRSGERTGHGGRTYVFSSLQVSWQANCIYGMARTVSIDYLHEDRIQDTVWTYDSKFIGLERGSAFERAQQNACNPRIAEYVDSPKLAESDPSPSKKRGVHVTGSGFFITSDGYFVTNHHVVDEASVVVLRDVEGRTYDARVARVDTANDLAVLKVEGSFQPLSIRDSRQVRRGEEVITVGFPQIDVQGSEPKITEGRVNSLSGLSNDPRTFQIDLPVQSGNSGGPLVMRDGGVIGVVSGKLSALYMLRSTGDFPQNVNYAIKSTYLIELAAMIPGYSRTKAVPRRKAFESVADLTAYVEKSICLVVAQKSKSEK